MTRGAELALGDFLELCGLGLGAVHAVARRARQPARLVLAGLPEHMVLAAVARGAGRIDFARRSRGLEIAGLERARILDVLGAGAVTAFAAELGRRRAGVGLHRMRRLRERPFVLVVVAAEAGVLSDVPAGRLRRRRCRGLRSFRRWRGFLLPAGAQRDERSQPHRQTAYQPDSGADRSDSTTHYVLPGLPPAGVRARTACLKSKQ